MNGANPGIHSASHARLLRLTEAGEYSDYEYKRLARSAWRACNDHLADLLFDRARRQMPATHVDEFEAVSKAMWNFDAPHRLTELRAFMTNRGLL